MQTRDAMDDLHRSVSCCFRKLPEGLVQYFVSQATRAWLINLLCGIV